MSIPAPKGTQKIAPRFAALIQGSSSNFAGDATTKPG